MKIDELVQAVFEKDENNIQNSKISDNSGSKLRNVAKTVLLKLDPNSNFYKLHLQKTVLNIREKKQQNFS